ncbi:helix-turn-helix domain-containing protein [Enterobacter kobei]|uniref:helix-turn-helix domain-containing protein n=1 Tax=Enterobacter kobei TaxID=208224 RepID=UPI003CF003FC
MNNFSTGAEQIHDDYKKIAATIIHSIPGEIYFLHQPVWVTQGVTFFPEEDSVYILIDGVCALYDSDETILSNIISSPAIIGASKIFFKSRNDVLINCIEKCKFIVMKVTDFHQFIINENQWENLAKLFAANMLFAMVFQRKVLKKNNYSVVRELIVEYNNLHPAAKEKMPVATYIQLRGQLSRSSVMNILSVLNKRGYITILRGRLIFIDELPETL